MLTTPHGVQNIQMRLAGISRACRSLSLLEWQLNVREDTLGL